MGNIHDEFISRREQLVQLQDVVDILIDFLLIHAISYKSKMGILSNSRLYLLGMRDIQFTLAGCRFTMFCDFTIDILVNHTAVLLLKIAIYLFPHTMGSTDQYDLVYILCFIKSSCHK